MLRFRQEKGPLREAKPRKGERKLQEQAPLCAGLAWSSEDESSAHWPLSSSSARRHGVGHLASWARALEPDFTRLLDEGGAMLWGRVTSEMMESYWPTAARGDVEAPPAMRGWAVTLEAKPRYVVSSTRKDFPWTNLTGKIVGRTLRRCPASFASAVPI